MFEKLDTVELRFIELEDQLSRSDLDGVQFTRLMKERGSIAELVVTYREYNRKLDEQRAAKEMLADSDAELRSIAKEELYLLTDTIANLEDRLRLLTLPRDLNDDKNVILEIRAGTGGEEAALFAHDLMRMYSRFAEKQGWKVELLSSTEASVGGLKEVILLIQGEAVYRRLKFESGVHRVQRVPATEAQGRIHTSACTVAILPEADEVDDIELNTKDLEITTCRSSGAGGQHVNKTDSAIRIEHIPTGIVVECQAERSQHKNKDKALKILKSKLMEKAVREQNDAISANRKEQVGSGDRSERIRTYNFPQGRLTDHRINLTLYKLDDVINGDIGDILEALATHHQTELLKQQLSNGI